MTEKLIATLVLLTASVSPVAAQQYDVLIRGGTVYDGSGGAPVQADIALKGDRIAAIGTIPAKASAPLVVNAKGKIVSPGFIDPHSHAAPNIETAELAPALPMLYQGITTIMINTATGTATAALAKGCHESSCALLSGQNWKI